MSIEVTARLCSQRDRGGVPANSMGALRWAVTIHAVLSCAFREQDGHRVGSFHGSGHTASLYEVHLHLLPSFVWVSGRVLTEHLMCVVSQADWSMHASGYTTGIVMVS